ncbi:L-rhamnose-binding lectin CSL3-like isoform X2 [Osmerus mordax]|uniref:L-rhamnose-binding lectin CSL3-like isoform X2 n=1 Tax=Osmerus mordax TaxID=8014 RepID=UPI00350F9D7B
MLAVLPCCMSIGAVKVICEGHQGTLSCGSGSNVIRVLRANYGRTDNETCSSGHPPNQINNTDCLNPTTFLLVADLCKGHSCSLYASNSVFSDPCYGTYKYLYVVYWCV